MDAALVQTAALEPMQKMMALMVRREKPGRVVLYDTWCVTHNSWQIFQNLCATQYNKPVLHRHSYDLLFIDCTLTFTSFHLYSLLLPRTQPVVQEVQAAVLVKYGFTAPGAVMNGVMQIQQHSMADSTGDMKLKCQMLMAKASGR